MSKISDAPYTQSRQIQYRGPSTSDDYNARLEENFRDLMVLRNRQRVTEEDSREGYSRVIKELLSLSNTMSSLEQRVDALENGARQITFHDDKQIDDELFNGTQFEIAAPSRCYVDTRHGLTLLPRVDTSSLSKLSFVNSEGLTALPSSLETLVVGQENTADTGGATIDTSQVELAIASGTGRIWQRNVITSTANTNGAKMFVYTKVPVDLFTTANSNVITIHPFPLLSTDILSIETTSNTDPVLSNSDGYTPLNANAAWANNSAALDWTPPGGWTGDAALNAGPKKFYFDPQVVTAFRIGLGQRNLYQENGLYIYSYGASALDLGFDKFLTTGQTMVRFDAPVNQTINNVNDVQPQIFNVPESVVSSVFSFQTIWETSFGSGIYTTQPVPFSARVWIQVTLNMTTTGGTPALSGLTIDFT